MFTKPAYELPGEALYPEGVAYDPASGTFFVGSANDGTILRGDVETGEITTFLLGNQKETFRTLGLKVDGRNRLWVAGGRSGQVFVYDAQTAEQIAAIETPEGESPFLNDLVVAPSGDVYVTDSNRPTLFKVSAGTEVAESWLNFTGSAFTYGEGTNANGIAVTPDEQYLLVIQMDTGRLYRIDIASQEVDEIDLGGETLTSGDGLVLDGQTLYVVRQADNEVAVVELTEDFASGTVTSRIQAESLTAPATAVKIGNRLLVVNTQFNTLEGDQGPVLPFTVSNIAVDNVND